MFNIDFGSEKNKNLIHFVKYGLTGVLVILVTVALVFAADGYDIDKRTGEIIHNGLVMVASEPVPADIYINGEPENDATKSKLSLPMGQYVILLKQDGFYDWSKKISVEGSDVVWLYYPRLIPTEIKTTNIEAFKDVNMASQSPDNKSLLLHESAGDNKLLLFDTVNRESNAVPIIIPIAVLSQQPGVLSQFEVIDWAQDDRTVLLEHTNGSVKELLLMDITKPEEATNLSRIFELDMTSLRFVDDSKDKLYAVVNSSLRRIDANAKTISGALIDNVSQYSVDNGYVAAIHGKKGEIKVSILDDDKLMKFTDLKEDATNYIVEISQFDGDRYLALADRTAGVTNIYQDFARIAEHPDEKTELTQLKLADLKYLSFSPGGQLVMAQSGKSFRLYDFEVEVKRAFNTKLEIAKDTEANWIDGFHLSLVDTKSGAYFLDYDGLNSHLINAVDAKLGVFYDEKIEGMFFFNTDKSGSDILNYSSLLVE